ncbi:glycoside hydrolase family 2 protein [Saccharicrinis aurantiacus]|uniref:glycoside hydrolase family 2 protein n=1 Tax=Saccharicrinis aurantiacus TaxID=1849719 RepID=UPI0024936AA1|nr:glycoside hydrolase family 2 TIM barrel-domain containing protein [Saccharicrinis aurantiacus]
MRIKLFLPLLLLCTLITAQNLSTKTQRLNSNWEFIRQDLGGIWEAIRPAKNGQPETVPLWQKVQLPHCFNADDAVDPEANYYQGPGWYRTQLKVDNPYKNGRTLLHFEGSGQKTEVYIGHKKVANHIGGYDEWIVDITDYIDDALDHNGLIPLSIRCDNSRDLEMIPSDLSDFNVYGGLYRYLNLTYVPENYISMAHITPSLKDKNTGSVQLSIHLNNNNSESTALLVSIKNPEGTIVYENKLTTQSSQIEHELTLKRINKWSDINPALYSLEISTLNKGESQKYSDKFGFRSFRFQKNGPFFLNEKRLLLRGTHRHEDHAGVGAAMTEDMIRTEMQLMKDMGVNFIRLGHYQQSRIVLNLCDSLGILVWEEIPWCRGGLGGKKYQDQAKNMLTNMITQHHNHPCVIIWGLGNENDWPGDYPDFDKEKIRDFMKELNQLSHKLDPKRKTAIRRCDFCKDIVDVYSPSIWAGWYRGKYIEYKDVSQQNMMQVNHFFHMEWGGSSHAGRHDENPDKGLEFVQTGQGADERSGDASLVGGNARVSKDGNWSETYICNLFDWHLKEQNTMPWLTGTAQWAFKDFSTPVRPENPIPYVNQKGVIERDFTKKESYYVFQSHWTKEPMIHIYGHNWPVRWGAEGEKRLVKIYSNCNKVELFLNGTSLGTKKRDRNIFPACGLYWNVPFKKGENKLVAVSTIKGKKYKDEIDLIYQTEKWGDVAKLEATETIIDKEYSWLSVKAVDENKTLCLDAKNVVVFSAIGNAKLIQNKGTVHGSKKVQLCNGQAKIKIKRNSANYCLSVESDQLNTVIIAPSSN